MSALGHGAPAMIPVRMAERSNRSNSGWSSMAANIVGTPCTAAQRSSASASSVSPASNPSPGNTMVAPQETAVRLPSTMPKQW